MKPKTDLIIFRRLFNFFYFNKLASLVFLFILAVIIRVVFIKVFGGFSVFSCPDTIGYMARARSLLSGSIVSLSTFGYTCYLALIFKLFGYPSLLIIHLANILLGSLTVLVIFAAGKEFYNKNTGILAAFICIFHINLLLWTGYILTETPFILFLSLTILYFFKFSNNKKLSNLFFAFIMLIISGLIRDIAFLLFIPVGMWVLFVFFKQRLVRFFLVILPIVFIFSVPWIITNKLSPSYVASIPWRNGTVDVEILKGLLWDESGRVESEKLLPLKIMQYERNPYEYTKLMLRKLKSYWSIFTPGSSFKHKAMNSLFFIPLYLLAALGLIFCRPICFKASFLIVLICVFTLASMIGIVDFDLRYHLPVDLLMIIFSAYGGVILLEKIRNNLTD